MKINRPTLLLVTFLPFSLYAQNASTALAGNKLFTASPIAYAASSPLPKLYQRNYGAIIGLQRGRYTSFELGAEAHWRKMSLRKPRILGATANMEYNFGNHVMGYKAGMWMKQGRVNLTYGANVMYFTDFNDKNSFGIGPSVGFRFLGFHFLNGYNFLTRSKSENDEKPEPLKANTLYVSLRYYFPVQNKFTWDRRDKEKWQKQKAKAKRKRQREKEKNKDDNKKLFGIIPLGS